MKSVLALFVVLGALGFAPLLGGLRYEAALLAGLIAPSWASFAATGRVERSFSYHQRLQGRRVLRDGAESGVLHACAVLAAALLHAVLGPTCEPWEGLGLLVLGPLTGTIFGGLAGATAWALMVRWIRVKRPRGKHHHALVHKRTMLKSAARMMLRVFVACSLPLSTALFGVAEFYLSPVVFAFDPFVGYFGGPLYDVMDYPLTRMLLFRVGTALTVLALVLFFSGFRLVRTRRGPKWAAIVTHPTAAWVMGGLSLAGSIGHAFAAPALNLATTSSSIRQELGGELTVGDCRVVYAHQLGARTAQRIARECSQHLHQIGRYFGIADPRPVTVYLFSSWEQKGRLIGARTTYIAKPWRREVYIQPGSYPHQVLGHELAHVVTGELAEGPLHIATGALGLVPDPGRVEGFAVAAAPREQSEGTTHEWAAAMLQLDRLPSARHLFSLEFFGDSAVRSYAASGSFIDFLHDRHGADAIAQWYGGADLEARTGRSWAELEDSWHEFLGQIELDPRFLRVAEARFEAPAIFGRTCPHTVDRHVARAWDMCGVDERRMRLHVVAARKLDPSRRDLDWLGPRCAARAGRLDEAAIGYRQLLDLDSGARGGIGPGELSRLLREAGDIEWALGHRRRALRLFERALSRVETRDPRRGLSVRIWALEQVLEQPEKMGEAEEAVRRLLSARHPNGFTPAAPKLGQWYRAGPFRGVVAYLIGRNLLSADDPAAVEYLQQATTSKLPIEGLPPEAARLQVIAGCRFEQPQAIERGVEALAKLDAAAAVRLEVRRLADRCQAEP